MASRIKKAHRGPLVRSKTEQSGGLACASFILRIDRAANCVAANRLGRSLCPASAPDSDDWDPGENTGDHAGGRFGNDRDSAIKTLGHNDRATPEVYVDVGRSEAGENGSKRRIRGDGSGKSRVLVFGGTHGIVDGEQGRQPCQDDLKGRIDFQGCRNQVPSRFDDVLQSAYEAIRCRSGQGVGSKRIGRGALEARGEGSERGEVLTDVLRGPRKRKGSRCRSRHIDRANPWVERRTRKQSYGLIRSRLNGQGASHNPGFGSNLATRSDDPYREQNTPLPHDSNLLYLDTASIINELRSAFERTGSPWQNLGSHWLGTHRSAVLPF